MFQAGAWSTSGLGGGSVVSELPVILVVEDEAPIQSIVEDALTASGFELAFALSGEEAMILIKSRLVQYRCLVVDIGLTGRMSGWDLAREVRKLDPEFPVIYMTGAGAPEWAALGVPNSVLVIKPFAPAQLVTAVSQLLNTGNAPA